MQAFRSIPFLTAVALLAAACGENSEATTSVTASASGSSSCEEITAFADRIVDVGIVYDYEPSGSPSDLASGNEAVFAGALTGGFNHATDESPEGGDGFVSFEVEVTEVATGDGTPAAGDNVYVSIEYSPVAAGPEEFEQVIVVGAPVVVFANSSGDERGFLASVEGFMTACEGDAPIGIRGTSGAWADIDALDEVLRLAAS